MISVYDNTFSIILHTMHATRIWLEIDGKISHKYFRKSKPTNIFEFYILQYLIYLCRSNLYAPNNTTPLNNISAFHCARFLCNFALVCIQGKFLWKFAKPKFKKVLSKALMFFVFAPISILIIGQEGVFQTFWTKC